jgi:hypothetical protein
MRTTQLMSASFVGLARPCTNSPRDLGYILANSEIYLAL